MERNASRSVYNTFREASASQNVGSSQMALSVLMFAKAGSFLTKINSINVLQIKARV